jgi:hypothetical protein
MPVEDIGSEAVRILINDINRSVLKNGQTKKVTKIILSCSLNLRE